MVSASAPSVIANLRRASSAALATLALILGVLWVLATGPGRARGIVVMTVAYAVALAIILVSVQPRTELTRTVRAIFGVSTAWFILWGLISVALGVAGRISEPFMLLVLPMCALASGAVFGLGACASAEDSLARIRVGLLVGLVGGLVPALIVVAALALGVRGDDLGIVMIGTFAFVPAGGVTGALTSAALKWHLNSRARLVKTPPRSL
jgi:hypothetical protein